MEPTRDEIMSWLVRLVEGGKPEKAADWAVGVMRDLEVVHLGDASIWRYLDLLSGADLQVDPGEYLHGIDDYMSWLDDFRRQV